MLDEYARYCLLDTVEELPGGYLEWWKMHQGEFPRLAQLARDIFGIPGMSAEVERLFSSAKLMLPAHRSCLEPKSIEAGECMRSWVLGGLFLGTYFDYLSRDQKVPRAFQVAGPYSFWLRAWFLLDAILRTRSNGLMDWMDFC